MKTAILIHGAGGGGWEWDLWKPAFERAGWRFIAKDLMPAKAGLAKTTVRDYVNQIESWIPGDAKPVAFIGASMGGLLAMQMAYRMTRAKRPTGLVLVNSVPPRGIRRAGTSKPAPAVVKWANGPRKETAGAMPDSDPAMIDFAWKRWRDESGVVMNSLREGVEVPPFTCPSLVVIGAEDKDIAPSVSRAIAMRFKADMYEYAGMSHVGPLLGRRAAEVAEATADWLNRRFI